MTGAAWIAEKLNSSYENGGVVASIASENVVFVSRSDKPDAYVGVVPTKRTDRTPVISLKDVRLVYEQNASTAMMIAIPREARWSGAAMGLLKSEQIAFGGVGDLLSAISYDDEIRIHRNKTFAFVDDGLRRHSFVADLSWIDSKKVNVRLRNGKDVVVGLDDAYDVTMSIARQAAKNLGDFDVLLKTNPNGSITSNASDKADRLGFQTLKWGDLFGYLAKEGR